MTTLSPRALARRQHIIDVATDLFCELGYEGASMSIIAQHVGGSKGTLYNYFPSKDELLLATMLEGATQFQHQIMQGLSKTMPLETVLHDMVQRIVTKLYGEQRTSQLLRVVISVGHTTTIGKRFFSVLGNGIWDKVHVLFEKKMDEGELPRANAEQMVSFLRGLCEMDLIRLLMGAMPTYTPEQTAERTQQILTTFFATYPRH